jgi:diguanylate cyclase (GGDEF)-like protein
MTTNLPLVVVTGYLAQAVGAVVVALVLVSFHRHYHREYLRHWAWSWWAFACYLGGAAAAQLLASGSRPSASWLAPAAALASLVGGYCQVALLLLGTYEVATRRQVSRRPRSLLVAGLALPAAAAAATVAASLLAADANRLPLRMGLRALVAGVAFAAAGAAVLRTSLHPEGPGRRLVGSAFAFYGLWQLQVAALAGAFLLQPVFAPSWAPAWLAALQRYESAMVNLTPIEFLVQAMMGIGMVIWLLEEERSRAFQASEQIAHLAYYDSLTELANRNLFHEHLRLAMARTGGTGLGVAVFVLDLDRFKGINDSLGHRRGDEMLRLVGDRLRSSLRPGDTIARLGGDEFAVLLPAVSGERDMVRLAEKVLDSLRRPFNLDGHEIVTTASLGISRFPEDGADPEELLKKADVAMYQAKSLGRDALQLYAAAMDAHALERLSLENDLRRALTNDELLLYFQPVLDAHTGRIEGVEALLRWQHPVHGLLLPADFLWIAEMSGLSNPLDLWVLGAACRQVRAWHEEGVPDLRLAVNLSARPFQRPDLIERVKDVLWETGVSSSCLELEITETLAMQNAVESLGVLRGLKELGVRIAIDDFGTGYSSLSYLRNFPIDTLKIDASFIRSLTDDGSSREIASAVIALAHSLDIRVVAEGVETESQWRLLRGQGCDEVQGYFFSAPLPAVDCRRFLFEHRRSLRSGRGEAGGHDANDANDAGDDDGGASRAALG